MSAVIAAGLVDDLYCQAVTTPAAIDDAALIEWMEQAMEAVAYDRAMAKPLRAAVRHARRLASRLDAAAQRFPDWRNGVDQVLGTRGWEPQLDLVRLGLEQAPDPELFAAVKERHRAVHFTEWMEGVDYEEWRRKQHPAADR